MNEANNIWFSFRKVLLVIHYESLGQLKQYRSALKEMNLNVHECFILSVVENKKEKDILGEQSSVVFINEKEFNLFGKLKNEEASKLLSQSFDAQLFFCEPPKKIAKKLKKQKVKYRIGVNVSSEFCDIKLQSESTSPMHLLNFVKETLEKIK